MSAQSFHIRHSEAGIIVIFLRFETVEIRVQVREHGNGAGERPDV
jgi:hypothetical protein